MTAEPGPELVLAARSVDLPGGLQVLRALPRRERRMVGPFVFLDQMGPATFPPGEEVTVLPHPHVGLSTVTYLFEGEGLHRDSLANVQRILPGEVNWMTAGRGIVHSERMRAAGGGRVFGIQLWVGLPRDLEESAPRFEHYGAGAVGRAEEGGLALRVLAGALAGVRSTVRTSSPLFYAEARLAPGAALQLGPEHDERAAYVVEGAATAGAARLGRGDLAVFPRGGEVVLRADGPARLLVLGGAPLDGPRFISWNFVSSSRERLKDAASDWHHRRFPRIPGETAYLPLPEDGHDPVSYR